MLLVEKSFDVEPLSEKTEDGKKTMYIEGIFMQAEVKNGNGRVYPKPVLEQAVEEYNKKFVEKNRALGELNHPDGRVQPDPAEAAILIEKLEWKGNDVVGKAKVLETPKGQIVKALLEGGFRAGVSSRGLGSVVESNGKKLVEDFSLFAVDVVDNQSAPDAIVTPVFESVEVLEMLLDYIKQK